MKSLLAGLFAVAANLSFGQLSPSLEHYIEEKFRDERVREYVEEHAIAAQEARQSGKEYVPSGPTPHQFMESIGAVYTTKGINHSFSATGGAEPYIAMNPTNSDHLVVTYMAPNQEYPIFVTTDGGQTWTQSSFSPLSQLNVHAPGTTILGGGDPVVAFDANGNLHLTYIYAHGAGFPILGGMYYANSTDGGLTFNIPANGAHVIYEGDVFNGDLLDRQWMHCDNTGGVDDGSLYMSCVYFGGGFGTAGELVLKKGLNDDGFTSNTVAVPHNNGLSTQFGNLKVDDNGHVHMACMLFDGSSGAGDIVYTKSTDGGTTFSSPLTIAPTLTALPNNAGTHIVHGRDNTATSLAVEGSNVYVSWCDFTGGEMRGFFSRSTDAGASFSAPVEFGQDIFGNGFYHLMPNVAADNGRVSITWYKVDSTNFETEYMLAESSDAGATFAAHAVISSGTTDFMNEDAQDFYGDYNCSEKSDCNTFSVFTDGSSGSPVVYFVNENACELGIGEISAINGSLSLSQLYPNPLDNELNVVLSNKMNTEALMEIVDLNGKVVYTESVNLSPVEQSFTLELDELAVGAYQFRVKTSNEFLVRAIVKH